MAHSPAFGPAPFRHPDPDIRLTVTAEGMQASGKTQLVAAIQNLIFTSPLFESHSVKIDYESRPGRETLKAELFFKKPLPPIRAGYMPPGKPRP